ncbi:Acyloxyacyl hydrolase [Pteropus alecto]|uniref:Acyloxyacyl hydrolase n=1 Tax=Pteropus alecto TaxID=9402 RepID=L5KLX9_PTEAL|nr:Acyloxyacyl hydrolase [Pteropus alecto]
MLFHSLAGCVVVVSVIEQLAQVHNSTAQASMERLCSYLPEQLFLKSTCYLVVSMFGPDIIKLLSADMNADVVCHTLEFCKQDAGQPLCHLYPLPKTLRGYHWRGRDCNDSDGTVYPGRRRRDPVPEMTTPEQLYSKVTETLKFLNSHLPNGSHVFLSGLPDGTFLWDNLHDRYHPLGQLNEDVTYDQFYTFLSCLQVSPCHGWMSSNKTLRTLTSQRAEQLSDTLKKIATSQRFTNFNLFYVDFDFQEITKEWQRRGGQPWQLIEPVDGFHPNEVALLLLADRFWNKVQRQWPEVLGKENPFNPQIKQVFGDQGGH